ncbi:hypothetical protein JR316_0004967 [Psilocybe cubensis]|uniref:Uncharacterized protein n=1 Tax=Psilocybe cubensis TaxID=181762 RepID=A0ACB8H5D6_PSICU|nr:hypothetical protein JR316_0004967 [Psilocybe cubensis]KAH9482867.1 hypothetical protein JR316_0004967 [Psilocybe cubensis]
MVFLDFYHSHVAHAAYSILRHRASDLWKTRDPAEALIDNRAPGVNKTFSRCEIVDLTGVDDDMDKRNAGGNFHGSKTQGRKESRDSGRCLPLFLHDPIHLQSTEPVIGSSGICPAIRTSACSSSRPILPEPNGGPLEIRDMSNFRTRSLDARASSPRRHEKIIDVDIYTVNVPKAPFNRARRILISEDTELPIATVSMRADIQFFNRKERWDV